MTEEPLKWLLPIEATHKIKSVTKKGTDYFSTLIIHISDPEQIGASFSVAFNDEGIASMLEMNKFEFKWLNIAEGYSSKDILEAAQLILDGKFTIDHTKLFKKKRICLLSKTHCFRSVEI